MKIVLQKVIADSGLCSRRKAEEMIRKGQVFVNDKKAELGMRADHEDNIRVQGKKITVKATKIYIKLNKPVGYTCTSRSFRGEKNVFDLIDTKERLFVVGRLDKDSHGLVFLTNDGEMTEKLTHPRFGHEKKYFVEVSSKSKISTESLIKRFELGISIGERRKAKAKKVKYIDKNKFEIILREGKNRQIRKMFKKVGAETEDLFRVSVGSLQLGDLEEGKWEFLNEQEIGKLRYEARIDRAELK